MSESSLTLRAAFERAFSATNPSPIERLVYLALLHEADNLQTLTIEVKLATLMKLTGYSESTCRETLRRMQSNGLATVTAAGQRPPP